MAEEEGFLGRSIVDAIIEFSGWSDSAVIHLDDLFFYKTSINFITQDKPDDKNAGHD
jgi:hypothetical protein